MEPRRIVPMDASFFECSFCSKRLKPPTFKCDAGHVVCEGCCGSHNLFCTRTCVPSPDVDRAVCVAMGSCAHEERGCKRRVRDEDEGSATHAAAPGTRVRRGVEELQGLYPSLALAVEEITNDVDESLRPMLKRAFQRMSDERAREFDAKLKKLRAKEAWMKVNETSLRNEVVDLFIGSTEAVSGDEDEEETSGDEEETSGDEEETSGHE